MTDSPVVDQLAPDVEPAWADDFILAMRLKGANGTTIAATLVEINDFVRTSGETAEASFGPARQYAESLTLPNLNPKNTAYLMRVAWLTCLGYFGVTMITRSVRPLRDHVLYEPAETGFGPPRQYAESLDLPVVQPTDAAHLVSLVLPAILGYWEWPWSVGRSGRCATASQPKSSWANYSASPCSPPCWYWWCGRPPRC